MFLKRSLFALLALCCALSTPSAEAQQRSRRRGTAAEPVSPFPGIRSAFCAFSYNASLDGVWNDLASPPARITKQASPLALNVFDINLRQGRASLVGNAGAAPDTIAVVMGPNALTFIEILPTGATQTTTLYQGVTDSGEVRAVHSRHTSLPGGLPMPSQFYGSCRIGM